MNNTSDARDFAIHWHKGQLYGQQDYIVHLYDVADSVKYNSGWENTEMLEKAICVAWLHDILEDTECTVLELVEYFSEDVVAAVVVITKAKGEHYHHYIARVKDNALACEVKIHDTLCNLKASIDDFDKRRIDKYTKQYMLLTGEME